MCGFIPLSVQAFVKLEDSIKIRQRGEGVSAGQPQFPTGEKALVKGDQMRGYEFRSVFRRPERVSFTKW